MKMNLFRCLIFLILFGLVKTHGRFIILAILGLAGLWMAHLLARDYQNITKPKALISTLTKFINKRSAETYQNERQLYWSDTADHDPLDCTKSFVCQVVAQDAGISNEDTMLLGFVKNLPYNENTIKIKKSMQIGQLFKNLNYCQRIYRKCPYTVKTMLKLIQIFGKSRIFDT